MNEITLNPESWETIKALLHHKNVRQRNRLLLVNAFGLIAFLGLYLWNPYGATKLWHGTLLLLPTAAFFARNAVVAYRIRKGYYGNNANEAEEILVALAEAEGRIQEMTTPKYKNYSPLS